MEKDWQTKNPSTGLRVDPLAKLRAEPSAWLMVKLGEVCDLQNGFAFKSKDYINKSSTLNFRMSNIRPGGFLDIYHNQKFLPNNYAIKYKDFLLKNGDLVIAMTDMATETKILGVPTIIKTEGKNLLLNQRVGKFFNIQKDRIHIPFLKYMLSSEQIDKYYKSLGRGGLQINIGKQDILNAEIPLPPISEQKRIVGILDGVFENIEKAKEDTEKNLKNAKELFQSYLQRVFENPKNDWQTKKLGEIESIIFMRGNGLKKSLIKENGKFYCILYGELYTKYKHPIIKKIVTKTDFDGKIKSVNGDVLVPGTTTADAYGIAIARSINKNGIILGGDINILRTKNKEVISDYLSYFLNGPAKLELASYANGTNIMHLSNRNIQKIEIPLPPLSEQKQIVGRLDALSEEVKKLEQVYQQKLDNLEELKKSILKQAFNADL